VDAELGELGGELGEGLGEGLADWLGDGGELEGDRGCVGATAVATHRTTRGRFLGAAVAGLSTRRVCWSSNASARLDALVVAGALALAGVSVSALASPPIETAPKDNTTAPKMRNVRTLADALVVEPGATCLARETMLEHIRSWRDRDQVDRGIAVRVRGSSKDPHALEFVVWFGDEIVIERSFDDAPDSCADLHAVVGLAIAIALDDALPIELGIVKPAPVEQVRAGESDVPDFSDEPDAAPRRRGPGLSLMGAAAAFVGVSPRASFGGLLSLDIRPLAHVDVRIGALTTHLPKSVPSSTSMLLIRAKPKRSWL
jgi:hypothetical protein